MKETYIEPEDHQDEMPIVPISQGTEKIREMEMAAMVGTHEVPEERDIIIESIIEKAYPAELIDKIKSKSAKEALAILATEDMTPEVLSELRRRIAINTNLQDECGQQMISREEAVALYIFMNSLNTYRM
jgi:hypothetical protein